MSRHAHPGPQVRSRSRLGFGIPSRLVSGRPLALLLALLIAPSAWPQYPGHVTPTPKPSETTVLRAVAVYEYIGDLKKPTRSRLVPVSIWDGSGFQPGDLYLANPAPLAVESGTLYELQQDGIEKGLIRLRLSERIATGWIGVGVYEPERPTQLAHLRPPKINLRDEDPDVPHFAHRPPPDNGGAASSPGKTAPAPDPDRPTLHKHTDGSTTPAASASSPSTSDDADRPTLHRHLGQASTVGAAAPDPDRPHLRRGRPTTEEAIDKVDTFADLPADMEQMVAVSDERAGTGHSYAWTWSSPDEQATAKAAMEDLARKLLTPPPAQTPPPTKAPASHIAHTSTGSSARAHAPSRPALVPPLALTDEDFRAFELSWGSGVIYVLSARTDAPAAQTKYVTVVARPNFSGGLITLMKQVTPAALLDYEPRLRLVDAVDARGDHRADLLFELRTRTDRQFALYDVGTTQALEAFTTAPSQ